jgi:hypothetical protein
METNTLTPTEIDTIILDQSWEWTKQADYAKSQLEYMASAVGRERREGTYGKRYTIHPTEDRRMITSEVLELVETKFAEQQATKGFESFLQNGCSINRDTMNRYNAFRAAANAASAIVTEMNAEFTNRGGWNRYFLVASSNGHIHSSTSCHTCNKGKNPTQFALVPSMSNMKVEAAVEYLGAALCTICFPDAPVEFQEQTKVSKSLATVLMEQGEAAFVAAKQKAAARAAKKAGN